MAILIPFGDQWFTPDQIRRTYQWRKAAKAACPPGSICYRCGEPIEYGLRRNHPRGPSADHILALENGGAPFDPANLAPCHFGCNGSKGARADQPETWSDW